MQNRREEEADKCQAAQHQRPDNAASAAEPYSQTMRPAQRAYAMFHQLLEHLSAPPTIENTNEMLKDNELKPKPGDHISDSGWLPEWKDLLRNQPLQPFIPPKARPALAAQWSGLWAEVKEALETEIADDIDRAVRTCILWAQCVLSAGEKSTRGQQRKPRDNQGVSRKSWPLEKGRAVRCVERPPEDQRAADPE